MSQYVHPDSPGTQLISTGRGAFITIVATAWIAASAVLISFVIYTDSVDLIWEEWPLGAIAGGVLAILGAGAGAVIALIAGQSLSRQFCWILSSICGVFAIPIVFQIVVRTLTILPGGANTMGLLFSRSTSRLVFLIPVTMGVAALCGIVLGILLTTRRLGFGARSRRAARIAFGFAAPAAVLIEIAWQLFGRHRMGEGLLLSDCIFLGIAVIVACAIPAIIRTERREETGMRFEVLPAQPIAVQPLAVQSIPEQ